VPSVIFDQTLTDAGFSLTGGSRVLYVAWEVTVLGPAVRSPQAWDATALLGVGHFELGNDLTGAAIISGIGYGEPHWLNTPIGQWIVPPGEVGSDFSAAIAEYIRWSLTPGTEVHLYILG
jgi:hypothetical protein